MPAKHQMPTCRDARAQQRGEQRAAWRGCWRQAGTALRQFRQTGVHAHLVGRGVGARRLDRRRVDVDRVDAMPSAMQCSADGEDAPATQPSVEHTRPVRRERRAWRAVQRRHMRVVRVRAGAEGGPGSRRITAARPRTSCQLGTIQKPSAISTGANCGASGAQSCSATGRIATGRRPSPSPAPGAGASLGGGLVALEQRDDGERFQA